MRPLVALVVYCGVAVIAVLVTMGLHRRQRALDAKGHPPRPSKTSRLITFLTRERLKGCDPLEHAMADRSGCQAKGSPRVTADNAKKKRLTKWQRLGIVASI